ncbi:MAG: hypothetical protein EXR75_06820 [Myxococcales bacterium]|nr:hypothetical protein [Myxococcales bacterium]
MTDVKNSTDEAPSIGAGAIIAAEAEGRIRRIRRTQPPETIAAETASVAAPNRGVGAEAGVAANAGARGGNWPRFEGVRTGAASKPAASVAATSVTAAPADGVGETTAAQNSAIGAGDHSVRDRAAQSGSGRGAGGGRDRGGRGAGGGREGGGGGAGGGRDRGGRGAGGGREGGGGGAGAQSGPPRGAVLERTRRTVYTQDTVAPIAALPPAAKARSVKPATAAAEARSVKPVVAAAKAPLDKLTLILHPQPKAARGFSVKESKPLTAKEAMKAKLQKAAPAKEDSSKHAAVAELDASWVSVGAEGALAAVSAAGAAVDGLVQAWLDGGNTAALVAIATNESAPGRKAARRAVNVLRARGVALPNVDSVAQLPAAVDTAAEITASYIPPDETGTSFFTFCQRLAGGSFRVADIMVSGTAGIVHASSGTLAGKHIRSWRARVQDRFGMPPVSVPLDWARAAIAEGRSRNDAAKQIVPLGFDRCAALTAPAPATPPSHPVALLEPAAFDAAELESAALGSDALHAEPEFRRWLPDRAALDELFAKVTARVQAPNGEVQSGVDGVLREEIDAATDRFFTPELRVKLTANLRDAAISMRVRRGDDAARRLLALGAVIARAGLVTDPPRTIPFLVAFFQKGVAMMARNARG